MIRAVNTLTCAAVALSLCGGAAPALAKKSLEIAPLTDKNGSPVDKKVCRRFADTGSIAVRRVCHTSAEWAAIDEANARNTRDRLNTLPLQHVP